MARGCVWPIMGAGDSNDLLEFGVPHLDVHVQKIGYVIYKGRNRASVTDGCTIVDAVKQPGNPGLFRVKA